MHRKKALWFTLIVLAALGTVWALAMTILEPEKPKIVMTPDTRIIGARQSLSLSFADRRSGLRKLSASITQDNRRQTVWSIDIPDRGVAERTVDVTIDAAKLRLRDGSAVLTILAEDHSLLKNTAVVERTVTIDTVPPQISLLGSMNHINPGGTCVLLYRTSEKASASGVWVDKVFFPGYPASAAGKPVTIVYFAVPLEAKKGIAIKLFARDAAGNEAVASVPYLLLAKKFRRDAMNLSDGFLQQKMPEFQASHPDMRGKSLLETFLYVNGVLREENRKTIASLCAKSAPRQLWQDTFVRMKNASPMALFGDHRTYLYAGKAVGESVHMGVDLASTARAPVEAVNSGVVVFAAGLGIYGNAVMIDHGLGLFSLYGHLSEISVKAGQAVKRSDPIGRSGITGLAGGDHLHLSLLVGGEFVNPQEWWDPHWIQDNVTKKMAEAF